MSEPLLSVQNLITTFKTDSGVVRAVNNISFDIKKGTTVGLVGESGSGKSVTSLSLMRLIQSPPGRVASGKVLFKGSDLLQLPEKEMRKHRGNSISMIFQEPMTSLNPVFTLGNQLSEVFRLHRGASKKEALEMSVEMLKLVNIPAPEKRIKEYPHQLSGGMRQRVMIAMALACEPSLLIADEPTTALDVTIQAQILDLMAKLQDELAMAILMITHDLGVVAEVCDEVMVMYSGEIIERGTTKDIFTNPQHPYTVGLLKSIPKLGHKVDVLPTIRGTVPGLSELPKGCNFQARCDHVTDRCKQKEPNTYIYTPTHSATCWLSDGVGYDMVEAGKMGNYESSLT